jgi:hypothetical protein
MQKLRDVFIYAFALEGDEVGEENKERCNQIEKQHEKMIQFFNSLHTFYMTRLVTEVKSGGYL